jgi:hypothetical protein
MMTRQEIDEHISEIAEWFEYHYENHFTAKSRGLEWEAKFQKAAEYAAVLNGLIALKSLKP